MQIRLAYSTNPKRYTIVHREKGCRRSYRCGYYHTELDRIMDVAQLEADSGKYTMVKVIDADTDEIVRVLKGGMQ